jgi:photosystem II stability/assembly factor-like uncharacterized protein
VGTGVKFAKTSISTCWTEATLKRDQPRTTDLFFRVTRDGRSVGEALSIVTETDGGVSLKQANQTPLSSAEVEEIVKQLMTADADAVDWIYN